MRRIWIISIICLSMTNLQAQEEERPNSLGISWGPGHIMRQDLIFTPVTHRQWSPVGVRLTYERSLKLEQRVTLKYNHYTPSILGPHTVYWEYPEEPLPSGTHSFHLLDINYSLGRGVYRGEILGVILGARWKNRLQVQDYAYGMDWLTHFGYYFSFGLDAWTQVSVKLNPVQRLDLNLALPLFAFNARSPYLVQDDPYFQNTYSHRPLKTVASQIGDGKIQSWGVSREVDLEIKYTYSLSGRWALGAGYAFSMISNRSPRKLTSVENSFYLNTTFKF